MMEFRAGQELHVYDGVSSIIYHVNETQIFVLNYDGRSKVFYKTYLEQISTLKTNAVVLKNNISPFLIETYTEAMKMKQLINSFSWIC